MAGIDKIYGTTDQYDELRNFLVRHHRFALNYLYPRDCWEDTNYRPISNFPEKIDKWLLKYWRRHKLQWVIDRIKEQYNIK